MPQIIAKYKYLFQQQAQELQLKEKVLASLWYGVAYSQVTLSIASHHKKASQAKPKVDVCPLLSFGWIPEEYLNDIKSAAQL